MKYQAENGPAWESMMHSKFEKPKIGTLAPWFGGRGAKPVISIYSSNLLSAFGKDVRRVRYQNNLTLLAVSRSMNAKGWLRYYPMKIWRMEQKKTITLDAAEMLDLVQSIMGRCQLYQTTL
jgi:hypothetical protein